MLTFADRVKAHAALGADARLAIVDALLMSDRTVAELGSLTSLPGNLLAHHLNVLDDAGLIDRRRSEGDSRRRYVSARPHVVDGLFTAVDRRRSSLLLFVCTANSARSQYAAALWRQRSGGVGLSAGLEPADRVNARAVAMAAERGVDMSDQLPTGYDAVSVEPDLIVSVCDRAAEARVPFAAERIHWSVPDPVPAGTDSAFRSAFDDIEGRVERLAALMDSGE